MHLMQVKTAAKTGAAPKWLQDFKIPLDYSPGASLPQPGDVVLQIAITSPDTGDEVLATCDVDVADQLQGGTVVRWYQIKGKDGAGVGEVCLVLRIAKPAALRPVSSEGITAVVGRLERRRNIQSGRLSAQSSAEGTGESSGDSSGAVAAAGADSPGAASGDGSPSTSQQQQSSWSGAWRWGDRQNKGSSSDKAMGSSVGSLFQGRALNSSARRADEAASPKARSKGGSVDFLGSWGLTGIGSSGSASSRSVGGADESSSISSAISSGGSSAEIEDWVPPKHFRTQEGKDRGASLKQKTLGLGDQQGWQERGLGG
ncbi:unnamed protein product [Closterium sp. NIES-64]|nr:unnamed protein product [Closterium sp. NIES-64]